MTGQAALVWRDRIDLHRLTGGWTTGMAATTVPPGVATAFLVDATKPDRPGFPPAFFFLQVAVQLFQTRVIGSPAMNDRARRILSAG